MNRGLLSDNHKHSHNQRMHIKGLPHCLLAFDLVAVADSSGLSRDVERKHEICGSCSATPSRRRWFRNFLRQVSLHFPGNSDPGSCLQQRGSSHFRSTLHLLATLENVTLRHFDLNLQRQVSLHFGLRFEPCWLGAVSLTGRLDALLLSAVGKLAAVWETRFNVGFDFATIFFFSRSLLHPFRHHFGAACRTENADIEQMEKICSTHHVWSFTFVSLSASWFLVSTYLIWILGPGWFCQITNQAQICGFLKRVSLLDFCPWWSSWSPLHYLQKCEASHWIKKNSRFSNQNRSCIIQDRCAKLESWFGCWCVFLMACHAAGFPALYLWTSLVVWKKNATLQ